MRQQRTETVFRHRSQTGSIKPALISLICFGVFSLGVGVVVLGGQTDEMTIETQRATDLSATVKTFEVDTEGIVGGQTLSVSGQLRVNNSLVLNPSSQPTQTTAGQIYYDETANEVRFFNGTSFQGLVSDSDVAALRQQPAVQSPGAASPQAITNVSQQFLTQQTVNNYDGAENAATQPNNNTFTGTNTFADISVEDFTVSGSAALQGSLTVTGTTLLGPASASSLLLSSALSVPSGGTGRGSFNNNEIVIGQGTGALSSISNGIAGLCLMSTASAPSFQTCPGGTGSAGVSSFAGLTGDLLLANSSTIGSTITMDSATSLNRGIASFNAANLTVTSGQVNTVQDIAVTAAPTFAGLTVSGTINGQTISSNANFTGALTVGGIVTANTITPNSSMVIGVNGQNLTLQGNASTSLSAMNGANKTTLDFASPTANVTYRLQSAVAGTYNVCTTVGNCVGIGASVTTSGGTAGALAKFSGGQTLVDSLLSESGSVVTVNGSLSVNTITPTAAMTIGSSAQSLILQGDSSTRLSAQLGGVTNSLLFSAPSGLNKSIVLPNASGTVAVSASGPIALDANGNITCASCTTSGGGSGGAVDSLNGINGAVLLNNASVAGSTITINDATTAAKGIASFNSTNFSVSAGVVNTIQDISVSSSPTFNALTLSTPLAVTSGGTGATTSQAALNNISQLTTNGDLLYHNGTNSTRLTRGVNGECLTSNATTVAWGTCGLTAEADTLASVTGRGATTATGVLLQGGATVRGMTIDTATATDDKISLSVTSGGANSFTGSLTVADLTAARTWTLPNETGTFCLQSSANCGFALTSGSTAYIQNQNASQQTTANFWLSGTGRADTALQAPIFDTATATALTIGGNATGISVLDDTTLAAGKSLTITGGTTGTRPASPTEGMIYFDTTTKQLLTYANGKWQADRVDAVIVAASNSSQADKDAADYVADGNTAAAADGDQVQINAALTAGAGKKIVLLAGTYVADATILIPNNTTLVGTGKATLIELADLDATENLIENSDTSTGTRITIQNLRLDGRSDLNAAGTQYAVYLNGMGAGSGASAREGAKLTDLTVERGRTRNIALTASSNNTVTHSTVKSTTSGTDGISLDSASSNNTIANNTIVSGGSTGIRLIGSSNGNTITGNTVNGPTYGIYIETSSDNTITGNGSINSAGGAGIFLDGSTVNTITGNTADGITLSTGSNNAVSGNTISGATQGLTISSSNSNTVTGNKFHDNGGATDNNSIRLISADSNTITGNSITDTSATTTNYAINIFDSLSDTNHLANNTLGGGSINNAGTGTIFGGQVNSSGNYLLQPAGTVELMKNTNVTGALAVTGNATLTGGSLTLGTTAQQGSLVVSDGSSNTATIQVGNLAGNYTYTIPVTTANDTFCMLVTANCGGVSTIGALDGGTANATGATILGSTLYLQSASGTNPGLVNTTTQTFGGNKTFSGTLSVQDVTVGAGKTIYVTGGVTGTRPGTPSEGMVYFDTTTKQLITYANSKWQSGRSESTKVVAANNSSQAAKDAADYVATGVGDQAQINSALTAAAGGTVYLMEGTYNMSAQVSIPNNTTLSGAGPGTVLTVPNAQNGTYSMVRNSDVSTGTNVTVRDLQIDGNRANQTAGSMNGINFAGMGAGNGSTARPGSKLTNLIIKNMRSDRGISLSGSNNIISGSTFQYNEIQAINLSGSNNVITGNTFLGNQNYTINATGSYNTVSNNLIEGSGAIGIMMVATYSTVSGNTVTGGAAVGIQMSGIHGTVTGNTVTGNNSPGVQVAADYATVTGNTISGNLSDGIRHQGNHGVVSGNAIDNNTSTGIMMYDDSNQISGNRIHNNGANGIQCFGTCNANSITDNYITDTAGSGYAIELTNFSGTPTGNYLSNNQFSGIGASTINDEGVGTIYSNQKDSNGNTINRTQGGALTVGTSIATASLTLQGGMVSGQLAAPALNPTVPNVGIAGTTTYRYQITALDGTGETLGSTIQQTTTGNATLNTSNYNTINWTAVPGAYQYSIYKCSGASCTPLKKTTIAGNAISFNDQSAGSPVGAAPVANTTGGITVAGNIQGSSAALSGGLTVAGATTLNGTLTATSTALFKNTANSGAAFQIQDSSSLALFTADTSASKIIVRTLDVSFNLTVAGHIITGGSTPTIAANAAACTTPTVSVTGTDTAGTITVTTGTGCATAGDLSTITFATAYLVAPRVSLTPASGAAAGLNAYLNDATLATGSFQVGIVNTPANSTVYKWNYHVLQ